MSFVIQIIKTVVVIALFVLLHKWNKSRSLGKYKTYYEEKRREFAWLDNYLKENPKAVKQGASTDAWIGTIFGVIVLLGSLFILSFIVRNNLAVEIVSASLGLVTSFLFGLFMNKAVEASEAECPGCHCPLAWRMTGSQNIVESVDTTRKRTEITRTNELGWETTENRESTDKVYGGRVIKDYFCDNCGHVARETEIKAWDSEPNQSYQKVEQYKAVTDNNVKPVKRNLSTILSDLSESIFDIFEDSGFLIFLIGNAITAGMIILTVFIYKEFFQASGLDIAGFITLGICAFLSIMTFISMKIGDMNEKIRFFFYLSLIIAILGYVSLGGSDGSRFPPFMYNLVNRFL